MSQEKSILDCDAETRLIAADALADAVTAMVSAGLLGSRTPPADALLDYRNPPRTERSDQIAKLLITIKRLEAENTILKAALASHSRTPRGDDQASDGQ